jgi:hypothetical protein
MLIVVDRFDLERIPACGHYNEMCRLTLCWLTENTLIQLLS